MSPRKSTTQARPADAPVTNEITEAAPKADRDTPLFVASISVRWRDLDAFNHVNNSSYLTFLEESRLQWLQALPGPWLSDHAAPVMAASELNYRRPIEWPAQLRVQLFCQRLGNSSMTLAHRIVDADDSSRLYCDGHVVMVWMNPATGKPVPLPAAIRATAPGHQGD